MLKECKCIKFKNYKKNVKSLFIIYTDFESILMLEDNEKQNPKESFTRKYQKHVAVNYRYKLVCVDNKFS